MRKPRFTGQAAVNNAVYKLMNEFQYPDEKGSGAGFIAGGGGSAPTVVVAASDATEFSLGAAHFFCTGTDDHTTIQQAADVLQGIGGRLILTEGTFSVTTDQITLPGDVHLMGMNRFDATVIRYIGNGTVITVSDDCTVTDITIVPV